ncbi:RNA recognition motif 2-domain-containing protein [Mucor mucedo]|uniref:RNA recognition motif 2-domain-containing protein n=1 Tax=Mucor mucedo TaxID=29922 RepID=UPI00222022AD|nr:RNA recognition motif 2-domain-containing protein [Mucor mucedo]KAI7895753.1 RNA recognition motif 2-domain-containing protein [Mucor mucedo]
MSYFSHLHVGSQPSSRSGPLLCQPWKPDNISLNDDCPSPSTRLQDTSMKPSDFKSNHPTRHIALFPFNSLTLSHDRLFGLLQSCGGEVKTLCPLFTEGAAIISYYKYTDAMKALSIINDSFNHSYQAYFAKPCSVNMPLNNKVFMVMNSQGGRLLNIMDLASQIGVIHTFSEACASSNLQLVNIEYDDERETEILFARLNGVSIEGTTIQVLPANNNPFDCTCNEIAFTKLKEPPTCITKPVNRSITSALDLSENHTYFSKDPFSVLPWSSKGPLNPDRFSSSSGRNPKNSGSKPYLSSSDCILSAEASDKINAPAKERSKSSGPSSSSSAAISDVVSSKTNAKSPVNTVNVDKALPSEIGLMADSISVPSNGVVNKVKKGSPGPATCQKRKSYSSVVSAGVKTKAKPSLASLPPAPSVPSAPVKVSYELDINRVITKQDTRTTFMIRNIPNKYTQKMVMNLINETHKNTFDFFYLRMDFKNRCNVGYAFVNFIEPKSVISFYEEREGKKWSKFNSDKTFQLSYAAIQGKKALIKKFQNSQVMKQEPNYQPKLFYSSGPLKGKEQPFPRPTGDGRKAKSQTRRG